MPATIPPADGTERPLSADLNGLARGMQPMQHGFPLPKTAHRLFEWIARSCANRDGQRPVGFDVAMAACGFQSELELAAALQTLRDCPGVGAGVVTDIHSGQGAGWFQVGPEAARLWEAYCRHIDETVCPHCRIQSLRTVTRIRCTRCNYERPAERTD